MDSNVIVNFSGISWIDWIVRLIVESQLKEKTRSFFPFFFFLRLWKPTGRERRCSLMVALASLEPSKQQREVKRQWPGKREDAMHSQVVEASEPAQPAQITSIECVVCEVWIAPLAILTLWSVGHHLAALTRLRQLERKSFLPKRLARALRLSLSVLFSRELSSLNITRPKRRRKAEDTTFRPRFYTQKRLCLCVCVCFYNLYMLWVSKLVLLLLSLCVCEWVCMNVYVFYTQCYSFLSVPVSERRVQRGNKRPSRNSPS